MNLLLENKIVMITGASKGLGYAAALQFSREKATVIINSRDNERLIHASQSITNETKQ